MWRNGRSFLRAEKKEGPPAVQFNQKKEEQEEELDDGGFGSHFQKSFQREKHVLLLESPSHRREVGWKKDS